MQYCIGDRGNTMAPCCIPPEQMTSEMFEFVYRFIPILQQVKGHTHKNIFASKYSLLQFQPFYFLEQRMNGVLAQHRHNSSEYSRIHRVLTPVGRLNISLPCKCIIRSMHFRQAGCRSPLCTVTGCDVMTSGEKSHCLCSCFILANILTQVA